MRRFNYAILTCVLSAACGLSSGCEKKAGGTADPTGVSNGMPGSPEGSANKPQVRDTGDVESHPGTSAANVVPSTQPNPAMTNIPTH